MRRIVLGSPLPIKGGFETWVIEALRQLEDATAEDIEAVISEFSVTGTLTEQRTFNAGTATATDLRNVLATMISDIKKRGQKKTYAA